MAIKHKIRKNGEGEFKYVKSWPSKAIRYKCVECMGFAPSEIDGCTSPDCPLFPFRYGKPPVGYEIINSSLKNSSPDDEYEIDGDD